MTKKAPPFSLCAFDLNPTFKIWRWKTSGGAGLIGLCKEDTLTIALAQLKAHTEPDSAASPERTES